MTEPIDIESLDPLYRDVFRDPANGTPSAINQAGCIALAKFGSVAWNKWRKHYPLIYLRKRTSSENASHLLSTRNFANFSESQFAGDCSNFEQFEFIGLTGFTNCAFNSPVSFQSAVFTLQVNFSYSIFSEPCILSLTRFDDALFDGVVFQKAVNFHGTQFNSSTTFRATQFNAAVSFENCEFKKATSFAHAKFTEVPLFHGAKLHPNTNFENTAFPLPTGSDEAIRAYRALKQIFSQHQATREELIFFKLEMAEEAARAWGTQRFLYKAYSLCSDFGFSITRPAVLLAATLAVMMLIYGGLSYLNHCLPDSNTCRFSTAWIEFSLLQSLPLPGLDKLGETLRGQLFPTEGLISIGVTLAVILHKAISLLALFLMGLALRNLFKLK